MIHLDFGAGEDTSQWIIEHINIDVDTKVQAQIILLWTHNVKTQLGGEGSDAGKDVGLSGEEQHRIAEC